MNDSNTRYGHVSRALHWFMGLLILSQFFKFGDRINDGEHWIGQTIVPTHVSIGLLILGLVVLRALWALRQREQRPTHEAPVGLLVKSGHALLYLSMLLLPVTGMLYVVGLGYGVGFFGAELISGSGVETDWMIAVGSLHSWVAWLFLALVIGHIAAALFHQFVLKDGTLRRMA